MPQQCEYSFQGGTMAQNSKQTPKLDRAAYDSANASLRLVSERLPQDRVIGLAEEVVRRLAFRLPAASSRAGRPNAARIDQFCDALLSENEAAAEQFILQLQQDGANIESVYLSYIAGASRQLGAMWESDDLSFMEVSLGTGRLYRIIRGLRHAIAPVLLEGRTHTPAMFALVPGETHTLGIEMAADLFRRDGGEVDVCIGKSHDDIMALADDRHYGAIVLVANSQKMISPLIQISVALRISQPLTVLALAGNLIEDNADIKVMAGADMVISDIKESIPELRRLTNAT